ncbi:MAG TPA: flavodoxin family protein [Anaerolineae bacterium]|nr:flavodoxin family protein [Anaerolineae bacterium]
MGVSEIRIVGISSSPRRANTEILVREALAAAEQKYGVQTEFISFKGKELRGCLDCKACVRRRTGHLLDQCIQDDDWRELVTPLVNPVPNGVIIGSPVYFFGVNAQLRAFMERCTSLFKRYWYEDFPYEPPDWSKTAAGALAVGFHRHGGQEHAIDIILHWFLINGFVVVGSHSIKSGPIGYIGGAAWQTAGGRSGMDAVLDDKWGLEAARALGEKVAETAILLALGAQALEAGGS